MEREINKLKLEYLSTQTPEKLSIHGIEDLMARIENVEQKTHAYFLRPLFITTALFVVLLGGIGSAAAFSTPASPLYQVKVLSGKAISEIGKLTPLSVKNFTNPNIKVTPPSTPTPTITITPTPHGENNNAKNGKGNSQETDQQGNKASSRENNHNNSSSNSDVKGASTSTEKKDTTAENKTESHTNNNSSSQEKSSSQSSNEHAQDESHTNQESNSNTSSNEHSEARNSNGKNK